MKIYTHSSESRAASPPVEHFQRYDAWIRVKVGYSNIWPEIVSI